MTEASQPPIRYSECPVCKSTEVRLAAVLSFDHDFVECPKCGIWFVPTYSLTDSMNSSGSNHYYRREGARKPAHQVPLFGESAKGGGVP
jgi:Zn-finger nucleic acid-binding protein